MKRIRVEAKDRPSCLLVLPTFLVFADYNLKLNNFEVDLPTRISETENSRKTRK